MIHIDGGHSISEKSLVFFRKHRHLIGKIESITMTDYMEFEIVYPFRVIGETGEIWLSGCNGSYGYNETITVLKNLGYSGEACDVVSKNIEFQLGPPNKWRPKPILKRRLPRISEESAYEVLDFVKDYHAEHKIMPTAREIMAGCESISSTSIAHDRLHLLQDWGAIIIHKRKHRGIVLL